MQVKDGRGYVGLGEHVVYLAPVVRLVVEEVRHEEVHGIRVDVALVVRVPDLTSEEPLVQAGGEGFDAGVLGPARLAQLLETLVEDGVEVRRGTCVPSKRASQMRSPTMMWLSVPWMLPKKAGHAFFRSASERRAQAS